MRHEDIVKQGIAAGLDRELAEKVADHVMQPMPGRPMPGGPEAIKRAIHDAREVTSLCKHAGISNTIAATFVGKGYSLRQAQQAIRGDFSATKYWKDRT